MQPDGDRRRVGLDLVASGIGDQHAGGDQADALRRHRLAKVLVALQRAARALDIGDAQEGIEHRRQGGADPGSAIAPTVTVITPAVSGVPPVRVSW